MNENEINNPNGESGSENFLPDGSFQAVPSLLLKDLTRANDKGKPVLEHMDIAVYALLKAHSRMTGSCYPSLDRLAKLSACSIATVQRSLKRLDRAGHIQRKKHNKGKIFMLTDVTAKGQVLQKPRKVFPTSTDSTRPVIVRKIVEYPPDAPSSPVNISRTSSPMTIERAVLPSNINGTHSQVTTDAPDSQVIDDDVPF